MSVAVVLTVSVVSAKIAPCLLALSSPDGLAALNGEWVYVDDRTEGRAPEQLGPPMSSKFELRTEAGAVILVSGHGSGHRDVRLKLDGSPTEILGKPEGTLTRYRGFVKDGIFSYEVEFVRASGGGANGFTRREFSPTREGLIVRARNGVSAADSVALYQHREDIALPTPAQATLADLAWLVGAWTGTRGTNSSIAMDERWGPAEGGAMLATSRTVSRGKMTAFEYLRIVEREGGLVYIAQPNGAAPTEFVLTELGANRAVFDNPRHDYPKRIVYELREDGILSATIGYLKGGTPRRFEFKREISER